MNEPIDPSEAAEGASQLLAESPGYEDQFPWLRRLLKSTLEATASRGGSARDELEQLAGIKALIASTDQALESHVLWCRERREYSWTDIGEVLGVTRQAARQRFASEQDPDTPEADRLAAEGEYLLAKMRADSARAAMEEGGSMDVVTVEVEDFERFIQVRAERHLLAQEAGGPATPAGRRSGAKGKTR